MSTTVPSASTEQETSIPRPVAVRWVFPAPMLTPLARNQVVGRDDSCDTVLAGSEISRRHAEFRLDGPVVAVRDLDSRNGVFVNAFLEADARLDLGDVVRCGEWVGVIVADSDGPNPFTEIAPGWYGGSSLIAAVSEAKRLAADPVARDPRKTKPAAILIQGDTGTGKEGVARALHLWSGRHGPFIAVNCAALPRELAEAELFGHRKGAFTGAEAASPGLFRSAEGGSIFLDEILELPLNLQAKLLRVLQEYQVRGVGETRDVPIDVRVIAATQESLATAVAAGRFRADLHARLDGLTVILPALRERREDIAPLFSKFLHDRAGDRAPKVEAKLVEALCVYDWPTNVRELQLLAQRLVSIHRNEGMLKKAFLPADMLPRPRNPGDAGPGAKRVWRKTDDESEFEALVAALREHGGSVSRASEAIGMGRSRAYRLLAAHPEFSIKEARPQS